MKAPTSDPSSEVGAEKNTDSKETTFDYSDFFSVLMYYGHMSMDEIMNHSRAFLHGIYRMRFERVRENLDLAYLSFGNKDEENKEVGQETYSGQYELSASDYPSEFTKLPPKHLIESTPEKTREFLSGFGDAMKVFKDVQITEDN